MKRNLCRVCAKIARETVDKKARAASRGICDWCGIGIKGTFIVLIDNSDCGYYIEMPPLARGVKDIKIITL